MNLRRFSLLLVLLLAVVACTRNTATPSAPVPSPTLAEPTPTLQPRNPTPGPDRGTVQGLLLLNGEPIGGHTLYLAPIIRPEGEGMGVAALDPVNDPRAESDASGYFVFINAPPGRYALGIMSPTGPVLINGPDGKEILTEALAGQIVDLGEIAIVPFPTGS